MVKPTSVVVSPLRLMMAYAKRLLCSGTVITELGNCTTADAAKAAGTNDKHTNTAANRQRRLIIVLFSSGGIPADTELGRRSSAGCSALDLWTVCSIRRTANWRDGKRHKLMCVLRRARKIEAAGINSQRVRRCGWAVKFPREEVDKNTYRRGGSGEPWSGGRGEK